MNINWNSKVSELNKSPRKPQYIKSLESAGIIQLKDLLWIIPLRTRNLLSSIDECEEGDIFYSKGEVKSIRSYRNFRAKGKNRAALYNISAVIEADSRLVELKWFNAYPNIEKSLRGKTEVSFYGQVKKFNQTFQILNPKITSPQSSTIVEYPTINGVPGSRILSLVNKIPQSIWDEIPSEIPQFISSQPVCNSFKVLHGKTKNTDDKKIEIAKNQLILEEFFKEQIQIEKRKFLKKSKQHQYAFEMSEKNFEDLASLFQFELTSDQKKALLNIKNDFKKNIPMTRLIQGDVGCGKTAVAFGAAFLTIKEGHQVAIMAPTESLAQQHYKNAIDIFPKSFKVSLLSGSTKQKEKKSISNEINQGEVDLIIGTHSLIQDSVQFKSLGLCVIDEQHKFGVNQRISLTKKSITGHTLIMSATPIPRSLSLTQYGDLEVSLIKEKPNGRSKIPSRIITPDSIDKFLSFILTRVQMGEQAYIVVPAIEESDSIDIENLIKVTERFKYIFPDLLIASTHGKVPPEEKRKTLNDFSNGKIQILIATSIIEVGIDVENATIMAVYSPERFGLSSLHQLRGRVGRGSKPGFFFMINEKKISKESKNRLKVIENNSDGFEIAEEDLKIRGEGDILGQSQSGEKKRKLADIRFHADILYKSIELIEKYKRQEPELFKKRISSLVDSVEEFTI